MSLPPSLEALEKFTLERILDEDPITHALTILGNIPAPTSNNNEDSEGMFQAIIRIEKTALSPEDAPLFFGPRGLIRRAELEENTDIVYFTSLTLDGRLDHVLFALVRSTPGYSDGLQTKETGTSRLTLSVLPLKSTFVKYIAAFI